ncbi:MAG: arylsulfatase [Prolixibacteraceae bacterium]|nr:arylsulfatase [Prolixibacteraceae bacterium]
MKTFVKTIRFTVLIIAVIGLLIKCSVKDSGRNEAIEKPNIIFILADDLGYGDLGCYGQQKIETPNIDALAANGIRFTNHYAGAPVCAPSRCVLLTGKHAGHAYIRGNDEWASRGDVWDYAKAVEDPNLEGQRPLPHGTNTIASLLQKAGYKTGMIGKWGLGAPLTDGIPNNRGFDFFYGYNCQRQAHTYYPRFLWKNRDKEWLDNELVVPGTKLDKDADPYDEASYAKYTLKDYSPTLMHAEAIKFIKENKDHPFFFYYATTIPHAALQAPKEWVDYYVKKFGDEEPYDGKQGYFPCRYPRATYAGMISYLDSQVGDLVANLKELGIYENTIILFSSDNGPTYNGGTQSPWFDSGGPFKSEYGWGKGFVHEGGIRIPMIVSWPAKVKKPFETSYVSAFYDVLPTLCDIAGVQTPDDVDGNSMLPVIMGKEQPSKMYYWEFPSYSGQQAVRMGKWKAIRMNIFKGNMDIELYDLEKDIQELNNVAAEHPDLVKKAKDFFVAQHRPAALKRFKIKQLGD